ncbi:hypothetical protein [Streptomyces globisporus]|uniref:hypothetical protein n=1 Tax=Streptomyces globisporus TaxID=1908 RepID=UPI0004C8185E|nr:hypothetical protein [Streptomyces globisporus]
MLYHQQTKKPGFLQVFASGTTTLGAAGTSVTARSWTANEYDAGRPTDGTAKVKGQSTEVTTGAQVREHLDVQGESRTVSAHEQRGPRHRDRFAATSAPHRRGP